MRDEPPIDEEAWHSLVPESRRRLLLAALECFAERGYHGTTTRDIATRANLSPAAIYMHYQSKAELLQLIMRVSHQEVLRRMKEAAARESDPTERVKAIVRAHTTFHAKRHTAARVANHEFPTLAGRQRAQILGLREQIEDELESALKDGIASGTFKVEDLRSVTFAVLSMGIGVARWFTPGGRLSPEKLGDIYADAVASMLHGHEHQGTKRARRTGPAPGRSTRPVKRAEKRHET